MIVSWRLLLLNVLGNVKFTSFVQCNAQFKQNVQVKILDKSLLRMSVLGTRYPKKLFQRYPTFFFKIPLFFSFHKLKLDDFSNSRANKRHFENFEQILSTVTLT